MMLNFALTISHFLQLKNTHFQWIKGHLVEMSFLFWTHFLTNLLTIFYCCTTRPRGYKTFSCSTQLSMKFILLINVKMPTTVCILTFISRINDWLWWLKPESSIDFGYLSSWNFMLSWVEQEKMFIASGPGLCWVWSETQFILRLCAIKLYEEDAESNLQAAVVIVKSHMVCIFLIQND